MSEHNETFWELSYSVFRLARIPAFILTALAATKLIIDVGGLEAKGIALILMEIYVTTIDVILAPLEPIVSKFVQILENIYNIKLEISPEWKQIFVLTNFYTFGIVFGYIKRRMFGSLAFHLFAAILFSLLGSLVAAVFFMPADTYWENVSLACTPLISVHLFYFTTHIYRASFERQDWAILNGLPNISWTDFFKIQQRQANQILFGGLVIALSFLSIPALATFPSSGILVFFLHMIWVMIFGFSKGYFDARKRYKNDMGRSFGNYFLNSGNVMAAVSYLCIIGGVCCLILAGVFYDLLQVGGIFFEINKKASALSILSQCRTRMD